MGYQNIKRRKLEVTQPTSQKKKQRPTEGKQESTAQNLPGEIPEILDLN